MKKPECAKAFTLIELLVVVPIIGIIAVLLLSALAGVRGRAKRTTCLNNLHQINLATRTYAEDHNDAIILPSRAKVITTDYQIYKEYVKGYAGYTGPPSASEKLFACPSDSFYYSVGNRARGQYHNKGLCEESFTDFTSYAFNGENRRSDRFFPGIAGKPLSSVREPSKTLLILEAAAMDPFSWHKPQKPANDYRLFNSLNAVSYVDGHVNFVKMYFDTNSQLEAWHSDPPVGYDYKWSGD